jgi:hypothetical protein
MSEIEPFGLWILTKLGNVFRAKHLWRFIDFTETKVTKAKKVTTGILQCIASFEKHRSIGNVNTKVCCCPILIFNFKLPSLLHRVPHTRTTGWYATMTLITS